MKNMITLQNKILSHFKNMVTSSQDEIVCTFQHDMCHFLTFLKKCNKHDMNIHN